MILFYKKSLLELISKLKILNKDKENLALLLDIQQTLIKKIIYIEKRVSQLNNEAKEINKSLSLQRLPKLLAGKLKDKRSNIEIKLKEYKWLLFVFRTIGDGVAFSYFDKWNIKSLSLKDTTLDYKEMSGSLSGKSGLSKETRFLKMAIKRGVPALLTDLTNCIRYGDICLMKESIPRLIEVKSSRNRNERTSRQTESAKRILSYLVTDEAVGLRGLPFMQRVNVYSPEINYTKTINELIAKALENQFASKLVEPGVLYYVQLANIDWSRLNECSKIIDKPIIYYLNTLKNNGQWINYYPFTLSIERPDDVYRFLCGDLQFIVLIDFELIKDYARKRGFDAKVIDEEDIRSLKEAYKKIGEEMPFSDNISNEMAGKFILFKKPMLDFLGNSLHISLHYFSRVAYEFTSLSWILDQGFLHYDDMASEINEQPG